ncbi:MAG: DUF3078 domain-containing protein [Marinilabiliaceae bacterium]|nr:DUF3078 domain-containing protein [Marinilabiliaceae bacterium]
MKQIVIVFFLFFLVLGLNAQTATDSTKYWNVGGNTSFTFSQVTLNNWAAGGENSYAGTFLFNSHFNYKKNKSAWDNELGFGYGLSKQDDLKASKTEDKLQVSSKYGYAASKHWYYSALVDFKTQVDIGYKDPRLQDVVISDLMSPGYLTFSLGMDFKKDDVFSAYISPVTSKMTFVIDDTLSATGAYGVDPGDNVRSEFGGYVKLVYKKANLLKNVDLTSKIDLFSNYAENPQNIDVDWETIVNMKINSYLTAMLKFNLLYDDDTKYIDIDGNEHGARTQTKQLFGFGLAYKFGS